MPPKAATKVKLDKTRSLRFRARAWEAFEQATGRNILSGGLDELSFGEFVTLVWCGCLHEEPDLPRDTILDAVDLNVLMEIQGDIEEALTRDVPQYDEADAKAGEKKGAAKKS